MGFLDIFKNKSKAKSIVKLECDYVTGGNILLKENECHKEGEYLDYVCLHRPSPDYNQHDGEYGYYLGPEEYNPKVRRYSKDQRDNIDILTRYFFCFPSYEDEHHYAIRACKEHHKKPTVLKLGIQSEIDKEKQEVTEK